MKKKTALVTGASRGIGKSIKESLLNEQIEVISPSRNELDLSSSESIDNFLTNLSTSVDILVNNFWSATKDNFATVFELTFSAKQYNSKRGINEFNFPDKNIGNK